LDVSSLAAAAAVAAASVATAAAANVDREHPTMET